MSMLWFRQAIFESKGDKLSSSAECTIGMWVSSIALWIVIRKRKNHVIGAVDAYNRGFLEALMERELSIIVNDLQKFVVQLRKLVFQILISKSN